MFSISGHLITNIDPNVGYLDETRPIVVSNAGYLKVETNTVALSRTKGRVDYELLYVAEGVVHFVDDGKKWIAKRGTIKLYRPGEPQEYICYAAGRAEIYWVHFTGYDAERLLRECEVDTFYINVYRDLVLKFKQCIEELQLKRKNYQTLVNGILTNLLAEIGRMHDVVHVKDDLMLYRVIKDINNFYDRTWTIAELAAQCHLSEFRFIHKFKECTGYSPMQYCTMVKMEQAMTFLRTSSMHISEIAETLGYQPLYFSRVFKQYSGKTPTQFRKTDSISTK